MATSYCLFNAKENLFLAKTTKKTYVPTPDISSAVLYNETNSCKSVLKNFPGYACVTLANAVSSIGNIRITETPQNNIISVENPGLNISLPNTTPTFAETLSIYSDCSLLSEVVTFRNNCKSDSQIKKSSLDYPVITTILKSLEFLFNDPNIVDKVNNDIAYTDCQIMDLEHEIENDNFNAAKGYVYAKKLQELRQKRREIKNVKMFLTESDKTKFYNTERTYNNRAVEEEEIK